mmetsp:Transcript_39937/g.93743  ORF Transcript_39937/g.93743 Transcript_39937/m.93743 type:complete len:534 (-) Transcript_39937:183-1784(-)
MFAKSIVIRRSLAFVIGTGVSSCLAVDPVANLPANATVPSGADARGKKKPPQNIILFLVDDLGIGDLGSYGSTFHDTPHIDRLARGGARFTNAYSAHPKCVPSRVGIFSGTYPARFGIPMQSEMERYGQRKALQCFRKTDVRKYMLPLQVTSLGEAFREEGYRTAYLGKWHLGKDVSNGTPLYHGFDISIGANELGAPASYFYPYTNANHHKDKTVPPDMSDRKIGTYLTDHLTDETIGVLEKLKNDPFFIVLSHYAVHEPLEAPERLSKVFDLKRSKLDETDAYVHDRGAVYKTAQDNPLYAGMLSSVDESLGRLRRALDARNLTDATTIVLTSDNGGLASRAQPVGLKWIPTSNAPYRHGKTWLYEGGIRVPLIVHAPDKRIRVKTPRFRSTGTDIYPTLLELAGLPLRPKDHVDGTSVVPAMLRPAENYTRKDPIFWHYAYGENDNGGRGDLPSSAVIDGDWKLIDFFETEEKELYNIKDDPYETNNVLKEFPAIKQSMMSKLRHWRMRWTKDSDYTGRKCRKIIETFYS